MNYSSGYCDASVHLRTSTREFSTAIVHLPLCYFHYMKYCTIWNDNLSMSDLHDSVIDKMYNIPNMTLNDLFVDDSFTIY